MNLSGRTKDGSQWANDCGSSAVKTEEGVAEDEAVSTQDSR